MKQKQLHDTTPSHSGAARTADFFATLHICGSHFNIARLIINALVCVASMAIFSSLVAAQAISPGKPPAATASTVPAATTTAKVATIAIPQPAPAAELPAIVRLKITGIYVKPEFYSPLIAELIRNNTKIFDQKTAIKIDEKNIFVSPRNILFGRTAYALVPVTAWAAGKKTSRRSVIAIIENIDVQGFGNPGSIFVSNSPETIIRTGELLSGRIGTGDSARFMIHHLNATHEQIKLIFQLKNTSSETAVVRIAGPTNLFTSNNEMNAGHIATVNFMKYSALGLGYLAEIPPGGTYYVRRTMLENRMIASGLMETQVLRGSIDFQIRALDRTAPEMFTHENIANYTTKRAHGLFVSPVIESSETYEVGGKWKFLTIGNDPIDSADGRDAALTGNYGVTYRINVLVTNPHETSERVHFDFAPGGGPAIGSIFVNGKFYDVKTTKPPNATQIISFIVGPGEKKNLDIVTIPEAGSNYPVRLILRSRMVK